MTVTWRDYLEYVTKMIDGLLCLKYAKHRSRSPVKIYNAR